MVTIKDVARKAGVSVSTVSNVINKKNSVGKDIVDRVRHAIDELNYYPNMLASNLKSSKVKFVGLILPRLEGLYTQIVDGIISELQGTDVQLIIKKTDDFKNIESAMIEELVMLGVRGIFLITCDKDNTVNFDKIQRAGIPIVFIDRKVSGNYISITFNNRNYIYEVTKNLLKETPKPKILLVTGPREFSNEVDCINGYLDACKEVEAEVNMVNVPLNKQQAFSELLNYINHLTIMPQNIIASSQIIAGTCKEILALLDYKNVKIFSLDGDDWFSLSGAESNIRIHRNAIKCGEIAAKEMLECISNTINIKKDIILPIEKYKEENYFYSGKKEKIKLLAVTGLTVDAIIHLLPNFTNEFGIEVDLDICKNHEELYSKIIHNGMQSSNEYDIFMIDYLWTEDFTNRGYLYNMRAIVEKDNDGFLDNFIPFVRHNLIDSLGSIYAIPVAVGSQMLLYRKDLFEDTDIKRDFFDLCGIELNEPKTWSEFNIIARFFTRSENSNSPLKYGTCLMGYNPQGLIEEFIPRLWAHKGHLFENGKLEICSSRCEKALLNLCNSYKYSYPDVSSYMETEQMQEFSKGETAMVNTYSIHIPSIYNVQLEKLVDSLGVCMLPGKVSMKGEWQMAINNISSKKEESFCFIKWMTSNKLCIHSTALGGFVPKKRVLNNKELETIYPWNKNINDYIVKCKDIERIDTGYGKNIENNEIITVLGEGISKAVYEGKAPRDALKWIEKKIQELIKC